MTTPRIEIPGYIAGAWDLDPVHSHVGFVARHMMVSKVRGGSIQVEIVTAEDPLQSTATATVDMNSVNTGNETLVITPCARRPASRPARTRP